MSTDFLNCPTRPYRADLAKVEQTISSGVLFLLAAVNYDRIEQFFAESDTYYRAQRLSIIERAIAEYLLFQHQSFCFNFFDRTWLQLLGSEVLQTNLGIDLSVAQGSRSEDQANTVVLQADYQALHHFHPRQAENFRRFRRIFEAQSNTSQYFGNYRYYRALNPS